MREIGSEFWLEREPVAISHDRDGCYVLSGRTAIDLIIQDILKTRKIQRVYMPGWCCDSMIAPFVAHDIQINLYDISFDDGLKCHTDITDDTDVFYVTNYFGYKNTLSIETVKKFKEQGSIILYDRTHSFLMEDDPYLALADYSFASIRKWMGVVAGAVVNGVKDCQLKPYPHLGCKEQAMRMKKVFMEGDNSIDKQAFLKLYGEFGHYLVEDYQNYEMDDLSYTLYKKEDFAAMRRKRRENAKYLHENLKGVRFIGELTDKVVPLFVPVFFETTEQRDAVRKRLIEEQIYCPIHWPKSQLVNSKMQVNRIFDTELSLICDQRYTTKDMARIVAVINEKKTITMYQGKYVYLRLMEPEDYVNTYRWRNDYEIQNSIGGPMRFISKEMERNWAQKVSLDNTNNLYLAICLVENDQMIGWYSINDIDYRNRKCFCGGVVIGEKQYRDGFAYKEANDLAFHYIIYELNMNRVTGSCLREQVMSRAMMEASYWKLEGVERESIYKNGKYHDKCHYAILRSEFFEHKKNGDYDERVFIKNIAKAIKRIKAELKAEDNLE